MPKNRALKVWNGTVMTSDPRSSSRQVYANVCAYSQKDAALILSENGYPISVFSFKNWWSNCWGNSMDKVVPERGLWVEFVEGQPEKVA